MGDTACSQAFWVSLMESNPSQFRDSPALPVENVSWHDSLRFIKSLNAKITNGEFRLPTEAEWEYACRSGSTSMYCFGDKISSKDVNFRPRLPSISVEKMDFFWLPENLAAEIPEILAGARPAGP